METQTQTLQTSQTQEKPRFVKLSPVEYKKELNNCYIHFIAYLEQYLHTQTENFKTKIIQTNLERIKSGSVVNILSVIKKLDEEENKLSFLNNLMKNYNFNFYDKLIQYVSNYGIVVTVKNKYSIMLHSQYVLV